MISTHNRKRNEKKKKLPIYFGALYGSTYKYKVHQFDDKKKVSFIFSEEIPRKTLELAYQCNTYMNDIKRLFSLKGRTYNNLKGRRKWKYDFKKSLNNFNYDN